MREFNLRMLDGNALHCYEWTQVKKPRAIIQVMPGFHEYLGRYSQFAAHMNDADFIVIGADHRGHGNSFIVQQEQFVAKKHKKHKRVRRPQREKTQWEHYLDDQKVINSYIQRQWPSLPIYLAGQTLGATLATRYAIDYPKTINGLVLSGGTFPKTWKLKVVHHFSRWNHLLRGSIKVDKWLQHLLSGTIFPKEKGRNDEAWISHDENVRYQVHHDPLMSRDLSSGFTHHFLHNLIYNSRKKHLNRLPNDFPILILSGKNDVIGNYTKQPREFKNRLKGLNKKAELVIFPRWRNDTFTTPVPTQATKVLVEFVNKHL